MDSLKSASASAYRPPSEPAPQAYRPPSDPHAADEPRAPGPTSPGRWDRTMLAPERWDSTMLISPPSSVPPFVGRASASSVPIEPAPRATSSPLVPLTAEDNWTDDELDTQSYRGRSTGRGRSPAPVQPRRLDYLETAAPFDPYQPVDDCHEQIVPPAVDEQLGPTEFEAVAGLYDAPVQPRSSD